MNTPVWNVIVCLSKSINFQGKYYFKKKSIWNIPKWILILKCGQPKINISALLYTGGPLPTKLAMEYQKWQDNISNGCRYPSF